jgi:hypothetical protein
MTPEMVTTALGSHQEKPCKAWGFSSEGAVLSGKRSLVMQQHDQDDQRDRNSEQPKKDGHLCSPF